MDGFFDAAVTAHFDVILGLWPLPRPLVTMATRVEILEMFAWQLQFDDLNLPLPPQCGRAFTPG